MLGAAIATVGSWRWTFFVNIPIGLVRLLFAHKLIRGGPAPTTTPLDWRGLLLLGTGIATALIALEHIRVSGTNWSLVGLGVSAAVALLAAAIWHLRRAASPLVRLSVLRVRTLRITVSGGSLYRLGITTVPFLLPLLFQLEFGWSPFAAGLMVAVLFIGNLTIKPITTPLMRRFGIKPVLVANGLISVAWFGVLAALHPGAPVVVIVAALFVSGALRSIGFTATTAWRSPTSTAMSSLCEHVERHGPRAGCRSRYRHRRVLVTVLTSYAWTFLVLGTLLAVTLIETLRLPGDAGAQVSGAR